MGAFDDLIPQQRGDAFADLVPAQPGGQGNAFADLIPSAPAAARGPLASIARVAAQPARELFSTPLGPAGATPETRSFVEKFTEPSQFEADHPILSRLLMLPTIRQLNRAVMGGGGVAADALLRGFSAVVEGGIAGGAESLKQLGMDEASADSLARDMYALAQSSQFPLTSLPPAAPIMRGPRSAAAVERAATLEREAAPAAEAGGAGARPPIPPAPGAVAPEAPRPAGAFDDLLPQAPEAAPAQAAPPLSVRNIDGRNVEFPDEAHARLFEYGQRLRAGGRPDPQLEQTLFGHFKRWLAHDPKGDAPFSETAHIRDLAVEYDQMLRDPYKDAARAPAMVDADLESAFWEERASRGDASASLFPPAPAPEAQATLRAELQKAPDSVLDRLDRDERNPDLRHALELELARRGRRPVGPVEPAAPEAPAAAPRKPPAEDPFESETIHLPSGRKTTWKGPMDLVTWLRSRGGIKDEGDELKHAGIVNFPRKNVPFAAGEWKLGGLVKPNGMDFDTAADLAWQHGYFPHLSRRPTVNEFIDALRATYNARDIASRSFRQRDWDMIEAAERMRRDPDAEAADLGIDISGLTHEQAIDRINEELGLTDRPAPLTEREVMGSAPPVGKATTPEGEAFLEAMRGTNRARRPGRIVEIDNLQSAEDIKRAYETLKQQHAGTIDQARRGVVSHEMTQALADDLGMDVQSLLKRRMGQAFNAHEALAARELLSESIESLVEAARKARASNSDENLVEFQRAYNRAVAVMEQVAGMKAEAGRALESMKIKAASEAARAQALRNIIDLAGRERIETLVDAVASLNHPDQVARLARDSYKAKTSDKLLELWYNSILSGPRTHATNILSNTLTALWTIPEKATAAALGALRRGPDKVFASEVAQDAFGIIEGARDGLRFARDAFVKEEPSDLVSKLEVHRQKAISGLKGQIVRVPSRLLMAEDEFFKALARRQEINAQAVRIAKKEGLEGKAFVARVADLKAHPTQEMMDAAHLRASYQTFQKKLSPGMQKISGALTDYPALRLLIPFVRTPTNLMLYAGERTPLGFAMKDTRDALLGRRGGAEADLARARVLLGTAIGIGTVSLAAQGLITGAGPADQGERSGLALTNVQPFSIKIGDKWYSYRRLDPFAPVLAISADLAQLVQTYEGARSDAAQELAGQLVYMLSQNIADKAWFGSLGDIAAAAENPEQFGPQVVKRLAGSLVPAGVAQVTQSLEPHAKDTRDLSAYMRARAGLGGDLPVARDIWGEPKPNPDTLGPRAVSPITVREQKHDKASLEIARLKLGIKAPDRRMGLGETDREYKVDLTPAEYDDYTRIAGQMARRGVDALVSSPNYDLLPEAGKQKLIREVFETARRTAKGIVFRMHPELVQRLAGEKREELTRPSREMPPQLRSGGAFDDLVPQGRGM